MDSEWVSLAPDFPNYEAHRDGKIRNLTTGRVLNCHIGLTGYVRVCLNNAEGKRKSLFVHRVIAKAFLPSPEESSMTVDHINRDRQDNNIENLRWATKEMQCRNRSPNRKSVQKNSINHQEESEIWFDVPEHAVKDCVYELEYSNLGHTGQHLDPTGYFRYHFKKKDGVHSCTGVHRIIAASVHGPIPEGMVVNHINSDRSDNRIENIEIVTNRQNIHHASNLGRYSGVNNCSSKKPIKCLDRKGKERRFDSIRSALLWLGNINGHSGVYRAVHDRTWYHGYRWAKAEAEFPPESVKKERKKYIRAPPSQSPRHLERDRIGVPILQLDDQKKIINRFPSWQKAAEWAMQHLIPADSGRSFRGLVTAMKVQNDKKRAYLGFFWTRETEVPVQTDEVWHPVPIHAQPGIHELDYSTHGRLRHRHGKRVVGHNIDLGARHLHFRASTGEYKGIPVHSVIAAAAYGPMPEGMVVNHRDGNRLNNRPENLHYVLYQERRAQAIAEGRYTSSHRISVTATDQDGNIINFPNIDAAATWLGGTQHHVCIANAAKDERKYMDFLWKRTSSSPQPYSDTSSDENVDDEDVDDSPDSIEMCGDEDTGMDLGMETENVQPITSLSSQ